MKYDNHLNYRDRKRLLLKLRIFLVFLAIVLVGVATFFYIDYRKSNNQNADESTTSRVTNSVVTSKISVFKSPYFQFQASENWREVPAESNSNKFLYRSFRSNLLEHELTVYVNQIPSDIKPTRVLPVEINNSNTPSTLKAGVVSDHCVDSLSAEGKKIEVEQVILSKVSFSCYGAFNQYNVVIGQIEGTTSLNMVRPDRTTAVYSIFYKDLRAVNSSTEINQIISTFQTR